LLQVDIMKFFKEFRHISVTHPADGNPDSGSGGVRLSNPVCGDEVWVKAVLAEGKISQLHCKARGCWPVSGCLYLLKQCLTGLSVKEALKFPFQRFLDSVDGVPPGKRHAFSLTHRAVLQAVAKAWDEKDRNKVPVGLSTEERL